ncbi:MAG: glycosyltransferase family 2 protein [Myxococcales bacterium]|nr:glycosyltransferase family 2 protein [Myxococcales bacterium]
MLSAVIIAKNEADRIEAAIRSVAFADEVLVLDSGSEDDTVARAVALGARVLNTDWPGFVAQKNRGLREAAGEWVFSLDADERVDDALAAAIVAAVGSAGADGFVVNRRTFWLGHRLAHGHAWPDRRIRLVRAGRGRWVGHEPHDLLDVDGAVRPLAGELLHDPYRSLAEHLQRIDRYTRLDARRGSVVDVLARPAWHLIRALVLRRGLLDGWPGVAFAGLGAFYTFLKWTRGHLAVR